MASRCLTWVRGNGGAFCESGKQRRKSSEGHRAADDFTANICRIGFNENPHEPSPG